MRRQNLRWIISANVAILVVLLVNAWLSRERVMASDLAASAMMEALGQASATLQAGPNPEAWPFRVFIPSSLLKQTTSALSGTELVIPIGPRDGDHVNGYLHLKIASAKMVSEDLRVRVHLAGQASYEADRTRPAWSKITAKLALDAIIVPGASHVREGILATQFRIVPNSIAVVGGWSKKDARTNTFLANVIADQTLIQLRDALAVSVPAVAIPLSIDLSFSNSTFYPFPAGGGTNLEISTHREPQTFDVPLSNWLIVREGIWLLGGLRSDSTTNSASPSLPSDAIIENRRAALSPKLAAFRASKDLVALALPASELIQFTNRLLGRAPLQINLSTSKTSGVFAKITQKGLTFSQVGIEVRPADRFASGSLTLNPETGVGVWSKNGLSLPFKVNASTSVALDVHLDPGFGGGTGHTIRLDATGETRLPLTVQFEKRTIAGQGTAILARPNSPCSPVTVHAEPVSVFSNMATVSPVGFEFNGEVGGDDVSSPVLIDSLPILIAAPVEKDTQGRALTHNPTKPIVLFKHRFISTTLLPETVTMDDAGIVVTAAASISTQDSDESEAQKARRSSLREAMGRSVRSNPCKAITGLKITGGDIQIVDAYKEMQFAAELFKAQYTVGEDIWKAFTARNPKFTQENLTNALTDSVEAGKVTFEASLQHVADTVAGVAGSLENAVQNEIKDKIQHPLKPPNPIPPVPLPVPIPPGIPTPKLPF